jgi:nitrogen-specific signal transduction histidine kinase
MAIDAPQLKVGAHVLVQLGSELVTDVEQAILECVKNSYDADAPGCSIEIDTRETASRIESGEAGRLISFNHPFDSVQVTMYNSQGKSIEKRADVSDDEIIQRRLDYTGRITIEDKGDGLSPAQLQSSWLVISQSAKRNEGNKKKKTKGGRTPLGDKGLGRLGSMKLGDILLIETATSSTSPLASAQFRWTDCETAQTIDQIPVFLSEEANIEKFKGTRVSVMGLRDLEEWRRKDRIFEITKSLAKLVSPFEATSTFPVKISLDGVEHSLVTITDDVLKQAIAEFVFRWERSPDSDQPVLIAEAKFRKRLFASRRSKKVEERTDLVFGIDGGAAFAAYVPGYKRLKAYDGVTVSIEDPWFITLHRTLKWSEIQSEPRAAGQDPGSFHGAFYFFHLDNLEDENSGAPAGIGFDKNLIKSMSGISILRDGFRVRSQGDWLELAAGMTSGSTYNMRPDNTVGYFALTGEHNYGLTEKSDREGFVEDSSYRGFLQIARSCRNFANDALESVRRALDDYAKDLKLPIDAPVAKTAEGSLQVVEQNLKSAREAKDTAESVAAEIKAEIEEIKKGNVGGGQAADRAIKVATAAMKAIDVVRTKLSNGTFPELDLVRLRQEFEDQSERALLLLESAAVGLSARGLAHELRTHLTEIRQKTTILEKLLKKGGSDEKQLIPTLRAIRMSCNAISNAAALIDPMLPRARATKETINLRELIENYLETRTLTLDRAGIKTSISGSSATVRANRSRLIQVIDNLVRNSVYWLRRGEAGGEVDRPKAIAIKLTETGFVISDSGPGVDPRLEETLFDIFVSAKPDRDGGQGLGLFIIKQLLKIDGCDVVLLSRRNKEGRRHMFEVNLSPLVRV